MQQPIVHEILTGKLIKNKENYLLDKINFLNENYSQLQSSKAYSHYIIPSFHIKEKPITPANHPLLYGEIKKGVGT